MSDIFVDSSPQDPRAQPLIEELHFEYESRYGHLRQNDELPEMYKYPPEVFAQPAGYFGLLLRDGSAVAGGAFKRYDDETAEFKRIWTHSALRRQGLARKVLVKLEAQALRQGYRRIYLTTGFLQPEAVALYLSDGYTALFDTGEVSNIPRSLPFEKWLVAPQVQRTPERPQHTHWQHRNATVQAGNA